MDFIRPSKAEAEFGLRAMKTICLADGAFEDLERELLESVQRHLLHTDYDLDRLPEIAPEELAGNINDPALRAQLVNGMTIVSLANGEQTKSKADQVRAYAEALAVDNHLVADMRHLANEHLAMFRFDLMRRTQMVDALKSYAKDRGIRGLFKAAKTAIGHGFDLAEARRFQNLGLLPEGTVGRTYWEFTRKNGFSFPGEPHGPPEPLMRHDLNHVLGGYWTTAQEEMKVAAFQAGTMRKDPFAVLVFVLCQFHLGVRIAPITGAQKGQFQPEQFILALKRGQAATLCTFDVDWNPFSIMERPLNEAREEFNIN